jgi:hypothetical protein
VVAGAAAGLVVARADVAGALAAAEPALDDTVRCRTGVPRGTAVGCDRGGADDDGGWVARDVGGFGAGASAAPQIAA